MVMGKGRRNGLSLAEIETVGGEAVATKMERE
jgi:hypothetical protein